MSAKTLPKTKSGSHQSRPFVTANFAITADGRISTGGGSASGFGSKADQRRLLEIRAGCDAILAGARTIASDTMTMGIPAKDLTQERLRRGNPEYPHRVIVSNSGRLNPALRLFHKKGGPIIVFSTRRMPVPLRTEIAHKAELFLFPSSSVPLTSCLNILRQEFGVKRLVCEGGGTLLKSLLAEDLVDELHITCTPFVFGGVKAPTLTGPVGNFLPSSVALKLLEMESVGEECFTRWKVTR